MEQTLRQRISSRLSALKSERSSWESHWREISDVLLPRSGRFFVEDRNRGDKRHNKIYDSTATKALGTLSAGLMAGMTSPARPWFRLTTSDPQLDESAAVKEWLADVTRVMQMVFSRSNTYRALHTYYEELGAFGTSAGLVLSDYRNVVHHYPCTVGEYSIATDARGYVDTFSREFQLTVGQMVERFGKDKCSGTVRNLFDLNKLDRWITIAHVIEPRKNRDVRKRDAQNMAYRSAYIEVGADEDQVLNDSGFKMFRVMAPRWKVTGGDIYGESPAMAALGDIKQLQHEQLRKAQCIDYKIKPPLQVPTALKNHVVDTLPGGISHVDSVSPQGGIRTAFEVNIDLQHLLLDIQDVRERINGSFYADLFLMIYNADKNGLTATEVAERHEEKLLMLGPVLERLHNEMLDFLIEVTFLEMVEANLVPPPPPEMQGMNLSVEFVSMLAQAQRAIGVNSVNQLIGHIGTIAQLKGDLSVWDKYDTDKDIDAYADMLGVDPELIVPGDRVAIIRKQRAEQQAAMQQAAMMAQGADTAQKLGSIDTSKPNALTDATRAFSGYT